MSNFVESATLRVVDESSAALAKISANLRKFGAEATRAQAALAKASSAGKPISGLHAQGFMKDAAALRAQNAAMRAAAPAVRSLGSAWGAAQARGDKFTAMAQKQAAAMRAIAKAAASAKASIAALPGGKLQTPASAASANALIAAQTSRANAQAQLAQLRLQQAQERAARPAGKRRFGGKLGLLGGGLAFGGEGLMKTLTEIGVGSLVVKAGHVTLEGAIAGSNAREAFRQSGNANAAMLPGLTADLARRYGSSSAAVIKEAAEVTPFSHDPRVQAKLVELLEQQKTLAGARGEDTKGVEDGAMKVFKGLDLAGTLKPDKNTGEVDLGKVETMFKAYQAIQSMEGRNFSPGDFRNLMKYSGTHAQTLSAAGSMRAMLYGADVSGSTAGMQIRATDRLMSGALGGTVGKAALKTWIDEGFAERDRDGRVHAQNEGAYAKDPIGELARIGIENMHKQGLDEFNAEDVSKYVSALHQNSAVSTLLSQSINRNSEAQREIEAAHLTNNSAKDAETASARSTTDALNRLKNSFENVGTSLDKSGLGALARVLINAASHSVNDFAQNPTAVGAGKMALMAGVPAYAGVKTFNALFNPLTASATALNGSAAALDGAAAALTRAAGGQALAKGAATAAGAAGGGGMGAAAAVSAAAVPATLGVGAGLLSAAALYGVMNGLKSLGVVQENKGAHGRGSSGPGPMTKERAAEIAAAQRAEAHHMAIVHVADIAGGAQKVAAALNQSATTILASEQYLASSHSRMASGTGTGGWSDKFMTPAEKAARQREKDWADDAAGDAADEKKRISKLTKKQRQELFAGQARQAQLDRAGITPIGAPSLGGSFGVGGGNAPAGSTPVGTPGAALPTIGAGGEVGGIAAAFHSATTQFTSAIEGAGTSLAAAGKEAAGAMREGIVSGGAAAAAALSAAVSNIHVNVPAAPAAAPTGPSTQSKG